MFRSAADTLHAALALALLGTIPLAQQTCDQPKAHHDQARLHTDLLCDYDNDFRPVIDPKSTVNVQVGFILKYISFDDSLGETFTLHSWVSLTWQDEFLKWDPVNYGGENMIAMESVRIWTPTMTLFNSDASKYQRETFDATCRVWSNGTVECVPRMVHSGICRTSLTQWPYDSQSCTLYFGSWLHTGEQINFTFDSVNAIDRSQYEDGPGWRLLRVEKKRFSGKYACCPNETYPMLRYTFEMQREAAGPAATVVIPAVGIVMLTLITMILDTEGKVRLILSCFSLFCHFVFLTQIANEIPKQSADTPIILLFIRDSMIITLAAVLLALALQGLRERKAPAPGWVVSLNRFVTSGPVKYVVFTDFDPKMTSDDHVALSEDAGPAPSAADDASRASEWLQLSNILNSAAFIVSFVTYVVLIFCYIPRDDE